MIRIRAISARCVWVIGILSSVELSRYKFSGQYDLCSQALNLDAFRTRAIAAPTKLDVRSTVLCPAREKILKIIQNSLDNVLDWCHSVFASDERRHNVRQHCSIGREHVGSSSGLW